jgi:hypothetical protein
LPIPDIPEYTAGVGFHLSPSLHSVHLQSAGPLILLFPEELSVCLSTRSTLVQPLFPPPKNIQETIWATGAHPAEKKSQLTCFDSTVCMILLVLASFTGGTDDATAAARVCGSDSLHANQRWSPRALPNLYMEMPKVLFGGYPAHHNKLEANSAVIQTGSHSSI